MSLVARHNGLVNRVLQTLDAAGEAYRVHTHPPIRGEADLHLTGLDWTTSVKTLAFALPDGTVALVGVPGPPGCSTSRSPGHSECPGHSCVRPQRPL